MHRPQVKSFFQDAISSTTQLASSATASNVTIAAVIASIRPPENVGKKRGGRLAESPMQVSDQSVVSNHLLCSLQCASMVVLIECV